MHTKSWLREATTHRRVEALSDSSNTASSCLLLNLSWGRHDSNGTPYFRCQGWKRWSYSFPRNSRHDPLQDCSSAETKHSVTSSQTSTSEALQVFEVLVALEAATVHGHGQLKTMQTEKVGYVRQGEHKLIPKCSWKGLRNIFLVLVRVGVILIAWIETATEVVVNIYIYSGENNCNHFPMTKNKTNDNKKDLRTLKKAGSLCFRKNNIFRLASGPLSRSRSSRESASSLNREITKRILRLSVPLKTSAFESSNKSSYKSENDTCFTKSGLNCWSCIWTESSGKQCNQRKSGQVSWTGENIRWFQSAHD